MCRLSGVGITEAVPGWAPLLLTAWLCVYWLALLHMPLILCSCPGGIDEHILSRMMEELQEGNEKMHKTTSHGNFHLILLDKASHIDQASHQGLKSRSAINHTVKVMTSSQGFSTLASVTIWAILFFLVRGCTMTHWMFRAFLASLY